MAVDVGKLVKVGVFVAVVVRVFVGEGVAVEVGALVAVLPAVALGIGVSVSVGMLVGVLVGATVAVVAGRVAVWVGGTAEVVAGGVAVGPTGVAVVVPTVGVEMGVVVGRILNEASPPHEAMTARPNRQADAWVNRRWRRGMAFLGFV